MTLLRVVLITLGVALVGFFPLLGVWGAVSMIFAEQTLGRLLSIPYMVGDQVWPLIFVVHFAWAAGGVPCWLLSRALGWPTWGWLLLWGLGWAWLVGCGTMLLYASGNHPRP